MKAIFLDRDGVINKYPGDTKYVTSLKEFKFLPGAKKAISLLSERGFKLFIISNQAGVGKGLYSRNVLNSINKLLIKETSIGDITQIYYCTHRSDENCSCRKPRAGMIKKVKAKYKTINLRRSFFIGDTIRDILTAKRAGCKSILVLSGKEKLANRKNWEYKPHLVFKNLLGAAKFIIKRKL